MTTEISFTPMSGREIVEVQILERIIKAMKVSEQEIGNIFIGVYIRMLGVISWTTF
jgi:hypothetical protein